MGGCYNCGDVYFDRLSVRYTKGVLREEEHYYPFGLPIAGMGGATAERPNRDKYQGNEYNTGLGLNWMDFHNRRYDPQLGRFLGVDPLGLIGSDRVSGNFAYQIESQLAVPGDLLRRLANLRGGGNGWDDMFEPRKMTPTEYWRNVATGFGLDAGIVNSVGTPGGNDMTTEGGTDEGDFVDDADPQDKKGDNTEKKSEDSQQGYTPPPKDGLPGFPEAGKGSYNPQSKRWRWKDGNGDIIRVG